MYFGYRWLVIILMGLLTTSSIGKESAIELQQVTLPEAIRLVAKHLKTNVILSPSIQGDVVFHVPTAKPEDILQLLLASHGLIKQKKGNVWLIAPQAEFIKWKQQTMQWREMSEATAPLLRHVWQIHYARAEELAKLIHQQGSSLLSKRGRVTVDRRTNSLFVQDVISRMENVKYLIQHLDIPVQQIEIAARLVSIDSDHEQALGIDFASHYKSEDEKQKTEGYPLAVFKLPDHHLLDVKLAALENSGHAELISRPSLFTSNQREAVIEAGEEVPYQETSENGGTTVAFKKAVLGLKVTPQVLPGSRILLKLQINQDRPSHKMIQGMPTISTRQIITNVLLKSGQTCVLGGIYEMSQENAVAGLPFLSHLPWLGRLFQQQESRHNKRELLIFVTPTVVSAN